MTRCLIVIASLVLAVGTMSSAFDKMPERSGGRLGSPSLRATPSGLVALDTIGL